MYACCQNGYTIVRTNSFTVNELVSLYTLCPHHSFRQYEADLAGSPQPRTDAPEWTDRAHRALEYRVDVSLWRGRPGGSLTFLEHVLDQASGVARDGVRIGDHGQPAPVKVESPWNMAVVARHDMRHG